MIQNNEPAAGVWRDARTQEIRPEECTIAQIWLILLRRQHNGPTIIRVAAYAEATKEFFWEQGDCNWDQVIRYARINT